MAICCETFVLNEITGKTLLKVIDEMVDEHFFKKRWFITTRLVFTLYD